jgi:DNA-directed RNA polymerase specialized sigma24 family protein
MEASQHAGGGFRTTRWSLILDAAEDPASLDELLRMYWGPIYSYIRRTGCQRDEAADLAQEFVTQRIIAGTLLNTADPERGRFRTLVKAALKNFLIDQDRRRRAHRRSPAGAAIVRGLALDDIEPRDEDDPGAAFDRQWATTLLSSALAGVKAACEAEGQHQHWRAFERSVVHPAIGRLSPIPLAELALEMDEPSADRVSSMIQTVRRRFRRTLRSLIEDTVADPTMAEDEAEVLRAFLHL